MDLNLNLSQKKDYPSKQYLNLAVKEKKALDLKIIIPSVILIIAAAAAFCKFAVLDRFAKVDAAEAELRSLNATLAVANAQLEDYDKVLEEYQKYSVNWMDDVEKSLVLKTDMIDLINNEILKNSETRSLSITGNTISAQLVGLSLSQTSALLDRLNARDDVQDVQIFTATTEEALENQVIVSLLVTMKLEEGGEE